MFPKYRKGRSTPSQALKRADKSVRDGLHKPQALRKISSIGSTGGDYYTRTETDEAIAAAVTGGVDLDDYYTKAEADAAIDAALETIDLSNYYTKGQVDSAIAAVPTGVAVGDTVGSAVANSIVTISAGGLLANSSRFTFLGQEIILKHDGSNGSTVGGLSFIGRWAGVERTARIWFDNSAVDPMVQISNSVFSLFMIGQHFYIGNASGATIIRSQYLFNDQGGGIVFQPLNSAHPAIRINALDGQTVPILRNYGPGNVEYSGFDEAGYPYNKKNSAAADASLDNNEVKWHSITTAGAELIIFKMKNSTGGIKTFTLEPDA
jgi:hypothetical protein